MEIFSTEDVCPGDSQFVSILNSNVDDVCPTKNSPSVLVLNSDATASTHSFDF